MKYELWLGEHIAERLHWTNRYGDRSDRAGHVCCSKRALASSCDLSAARTLSLIFIARAKSRKAFSACVYSDLFPRHLLDLLCEVCHLQTSLESQQHVHHN